MARATYILRDGQLVEKASGMAAEMPAGEIAMPMVMRDTPEYRSPIDGRLITSRSHRREDLKRNNCVEWDPSMSPTRGKAGFKNERFAQKHGLPIGARNG
jgi:hypothetical protein